MLLIGYGNPGRRDDGLGPALAGAIAAADLPGVEVESGYQLLPEDALAVGIRGYDFDGFGEDLSDGARRNLAAAVAFLAGRLGRGR